MCIGMNSVVVLLMLLLAVPLQLFLSHYINTSYATSASADSATSGEALPLGGSVSKSSGDIHSVRMEALHRQVKNNCTETHNGNPHPVLIAMLNSMIIILVEWIL